MAFVTPLPMHGVMEGERKKDSSGGNKHILWGGPSETGFVMRQSGMSWDIDRNTGRHK